MKNSIITMENALDRLSEIKPSSAKKIEIYAQRCYHDFMNPGIIEWWKSKRNDKDVVRSITRPFYDLVHSCSIPTGLITRTAFEKLQSNKKFVATKDHCFRPQNTYQYMLDNRESFCEFSTFRKWYIMCCSTVLVVGKENDRLSLEGIDNRRGKYIIKVLTDQQYIHAGLDLYSYSTDREWKDRTLTLESNLIAAPKDLLEYEKKFLVSNQTSPLMEFMK
jgi:hypothetical protein